MIGVVSSDQVVAGGSNDNLQYNCIGVLCGADAHYDSVNHWVGVQKTATAPLDVDNNIGAGVSTPSSLTASLVLDTAVSSPSGSATQLNAPTNPSGFSFTFNYIDQPTDSGQFTTQNLGGSGFIASGQSITYTVVAYINDGPVRVANPNIFTLNTFTDVINDGTTPFEMDIGGWQAPNGYADGYILVRSDDTGTYQKDIGNVTSFNDTHFTTNDAYVNSAYASTGATWSPGLAQYKSYLGTIYRTDYITNDNTDANVSGAYLMISASWSAATDDGFIYRTANSAGFFDLTTGTSFADYGQSGSGDPYSAFSSVAFPYFDQSGVTDGSFSSSSQNDGTGSYTATGATYNYFIYEYKVNPVTGVKYVTSGYAFALNDNNDSQPFTWGVDLNAGNGDGRIWINTDSGTGGDIGGGTHFDDDGAQPAAPDISHGLGSYSGSTRNFSAYGLATSPATKYSSTHGAYSVTDNNPVGGYVIKHTLSTYGSATGLKDIESSYRGPGYDYFNSTGTPSSYIQTSSGLGDNVITPSTLGFVASGQTLTYHALAKKTILATVIYSPSYASGSITFPNNGLNYTVPITVGAVSGATYRVNKVGTGWQDFSSNSFQDDTSNGWAGSSTITPTSIISTPTAILQKTVSADTELPILVLSNNNNGTVANTGIRYEYGLGGGALAAQTYVEGGGNFGMVSYNGIFDFMNSSRTLESRIGPTQLLLNNQHNNYEIIVQGVSNPILYADDHFFGVNHNTTSPDVSTLFSVRDTNAQNYRMLQLLGAGGSGDYINASGKVVGQSFIVDSNAHGVFAAGSTSSSVSLLIGGQSSSVAALLLNPGTLKASPLAYAIENDGNDLWFTNGSASRRDLLKTGTTSKLTSGQLAIADSNGNLIDAQTKESGSLLISPLQIEAKNGITLDSGKNIGMGGGGAYTGGYRTTLGSLSASTNLNISNHSPYTEFTGSTAGRTLTLPTAASISGSVFWIYNRASVSVTVATTSSQNINYGNATQTSIVLQPGDFAWFEATASTTWNAFLVPNILTETHGGTNQTSYASGDTLYASSGNTLSKLSIGASGTVLHGGTFPSYSAVAASTDVTGILPIANGGTNISTYASGDIVYASATNTLSKLAKNTTATRYLANTGTANIPSWDQVNISNGVTGTLPVANGGTGSAVNFTDLVALANQGADIGSTNFTHGNVAGTYRVNYSIEDTTSDLTAGTLTLTISYTDDAGAATTTANQVLTGTGRTSGLIYLQTASGNVSYAVSHTGLFGTAKYSLYASLERIS